jgi:hypothetical protein
MTDYHIYCYIVAIMSHIGRCSISNLAKTLGNMSHDLLTDLLHKDWDGQILLWYCIQRIHPLTKGYLIIESHGFRYANTRGA